MLTVRHVTYRSGMGPLQPALGSHNMAKWAGDVYRAPMPNALPQHFVGSVYHGTTRKEAPATPAELAAYLDHALAHNLQEGGRFNAPGEFGAVYLALDERTPQLESEHCELVLELDARLSRVADLVDPAQHGAWELNAAILCSDHHGPCQRAGARIRAAGFEAIRYPSAMGGGINLVVFWDRRQADSSLRLAGRIEVDHQSRKR